MTICDLVEMFEGLDWDQEVVCYCPDQGDFVPVKGFYYGLGRVELDTMGDD